MKDGYARRLATLALMAQRLAPVLGESVQPKLIRYDREEKHWVYPVHAPARKVGDYWVTDCLRVYLYDERKTLWYVSEVPQTLARYSCEKLSREAEQAFADHLARLGELGHPAPDRQTLGADSDGARWSDL